MIYLVIDKLIKVLLLNPENIFDLIFQSLLPLSIQLPHIGQSRLHIFLHPHHIANKALVYDHSFLYLA